MKILNLLILLSAICQTGIAQVNGSVVDAQTNEPLIGANIYSKSNWQIGTSTDEQGKFQLAGISKGDTLIISFIGYKEKQHAISKNGNAAIDIKLMPNPFDMNEVLIEAEKLIAEEFSYNRIERIEIYMNPSARADPLLAVNSLPSSTTLDESANISFRGSSPAETGIFFNNVPLYDAIRFSQLNGIGTFSIFNTAIVDEMLVFPGNPPLEYGNTTSGLVAIKTAEDIPEVPVNSINISLASYGVLTQRPIGKKSAFTLFSNYQPSAIIKGLNGDALEDIESFRSFDLGANFIHHFSENAVLKVFNYSLFEGYDYNYKIPTFNGTFHQNKKRNFTITNYRKKVNQAEWTINSNLSFSDADFGYADTDIAIKNLDAFISANYQYNHPKYHFKSGLAMDYRKQKFDGTYYSFSYAEGPGYPVISSHGIYDVALPEVYTYFTYYLSDEMIVGGGLRKNIPTAEQSNYLSGQINTKINWNKNINTSITLGKYHKYNLPQNDMAPTALLSSSQLSAQFNWQKNRHKVSTALFTKHTLNNQYKTTIKGAELYLETNISSDLKAQISYTLIDGTTTYENYEEYPSDYDLNYFVRGNFKYELSNQWTITTTFSFREGQHYQPLQSTSYDTDLGVFQPEYAALNEQSRLPAYNKIDLSVTKLIPVNEKTNIIAFGSISNILNSKNTRSYAYNFDYSMRIAQYFSKRTMYFGVAINF